MSGVSKSRLPLSYSPVIKLITPSCCKGLVSLSADLSSLIYFFSKYLLNASYMPNTVLYGMDMYVYEASKILCPGVGHSFPTNFSLPEPIYISKFWTSVFCSAYWLASSLALCTFCLVCSVRNHSSFACQFQNWVVFTISSILFVLWDWFHTLGCFREFRKEREVTLFPIYHLG